MLMLGVAPVAGADAIAVAHGVSHGVAAPCVDVLRDSIVATALCVSAIHSIRVRVWQSST